MHVCEREHHGRVPGDLTSVASLGEFVKAVQQQQGSANGLAVSGSGVTSWLVVVGEAEHFLGEYLVLVSGRPTSQKLDSNSIYH